VKARSAKLLFVVSIARSGGTLLARMLSEQPHIVIAADPFLPIYRSFRNAAIEASSMGGGFNPDEPIQDYYFSNERLAQLDAIQQASLQLPFSVNWLDGLRDSIVQRLRAQCEDLIPSVGDICGNTHLELLQSALNVVRRLRGTADSRWVGTKEVWTIEFIRPLAAALPEARFIVLVRDIRAAVASMLGLRDSQPGSVAQPLGYARQWRKMCAFVEHYRSDPDFEGRIQVVRYEDLVSTPRTVMSELCEFLGVDATLGGGTGATWRGNSSFDENIVGISPHQNRHWRQMLPDSVRTMIEFLCREELECWGYAGEARVGVPADAGQRIEKYLELTRKEAASWQCSSRSPQQEVQLESARRKMLEAATAETKEQTIRSNFLFEEAFHRLRGARSLGQESKSRESERRSNEPARGPLAGVAP
jgi:hypothetical protein